jgi:hypothetical protein
MAAGGCPFAAIKQEDGIGLEFRIGPGIVGDVALNMVVMVGNTYIIDTRRLAEGDDLSDGIVGGVIAMGRVYVELSL